MDPAGALPDGDGGLAVVRIKPLGAGGGGIEASARNEDSECAVHSSGRGVHVRRPTLGRHGERLFGYPQHIIAPEQDQAALYDTFMPQRVAAFLAGVNVNIMAYGQTGCGKTYTMFGPPGLMAEAATGAFGRSVHPDYGLFPRGLLHILELLQSQQGSLRYELTASAVELTATEGNLDMFTKSQRGIDSKQVKMVFSGACGVVCDKATKPARLYGMTQVSLTDEESVYELFSAIACRNTSGTGLNDASSRSHCFVFLTLYVADASGRVRTSRFQFVDLAGSERLRDAHGGLWSESSGAMEGMFTNYSLMMLSQRVRELVAARRRGKKSEALVKQSFKSQCDPDLLPLLGESLTGAALSLIVVCVSSAPDNASQSVNTLEFGETFSQLSVQPEEMPFVPMKELQKRAEVLIASGGARHSTPSAGADKYTVIRAAQARDGRQLLEILARLTRA